MARKKVRPPGDGGDDDVSPVDPSEVVLERLRDGPCHPVWLRTVVDDPEGVVAALRARGHQIDELTLLPPHTPAYALCEDGVYLGVAPSLLRREDPVTDQINAALADLRKTIAEYSALAANLREQNDWLLGGFLRVLDVVVAAQTAPRFDLAKDRLTELSQTVLGILEEARAIQLKLKTPTDPRDDGGGENQEPTEPTDPQEKGDEPLAEEETADRAEGRDR